jgi:hypothetical protein
MLKWSCSFQLIREKAFIEISHQNRFGIPENEVLGRIFEIKR